MKPKDLKDPPVFMYDSLPSIAPWWVIIFNKAPSSLCRAGF